jgi:hypothetical protein
MRGPFIAVAALLLVGAAEPQSGPASAYEGASPQWVKYTSSPLTDWTNRIIELPNGRIVSAGFTNRDDRAEAPDWNAFVEGYDAQGRWIWGQSFGGPGVDAAWAVLQGSDGRFVLGGFSAERSGGDWDAALTITDERATETISRRFGGKGDDRATDVVELAGGLLLVGQTDSSGAGGIDVFVVKTDPKGNELWRRTYGTATDDRGFYGLSLPDGGAVIAGVTGPRGSYDLLLMRIAADGSEVWRRVVGGEANDATHGLAWLPDGRILLTGYGASWGGRGNDVSVLIFDQDGGLLSHQAIGGPGDDRVQFAAAAANGEVWLTGYTKSFSPDWRMLLARLGRDGRIEPWLGAVGGKGDTNGSAVTVARNGDLLLGGYSRVPSGGAAPPDAFTMRVAPPMVERRTDGVEVREVPLKCHDADKRTRICR